MGWLQLLADRGKTVAACKSTGRRGCRLQSASEAEWIGVVDDTSIYMPGMYRAPGAKSCSEDKARMSLMGRRPCYCDSSQTLTTGGVRVLVVYCGVHDRGTGVANTRGSLMR